MLWSGFYLTFSLLERRKSRKSPDLSRPHHQTRNWSSPWTCCPCSCTGSQHQTGTRTGRHPPPAGSAPGLRPGPRPAAGGAGTPVLLGPTSPGRASPPAPEGEGRHLGRRCRPGGRRSAGRSWRGLSARGPPAPACCSRLRSSCRSADLRNGDEQDEEAGTSEELSTVQTERSEAQKKEKTTVLFSFCPSRGLKDEFDLRELRLNQDLRETLK